MTSELLQQPEKLSWRFPRTFWFANAAELFERAAFYGMFIALVLYLTRKVGFSDVEAGYVGMCFSSIIYLLPTFLGAMADKIGFRRALTVAFALLTAGYALLGAFQYKSTAIAALALIMFGGAIVKPVISGTVAKCSDEAHRARAFSIFYQVVNIGAFFGKTVAKPLRTGLDLPYIGRLELGLEYINFYAAAMAFCALLFVVLFYRNVDTEGMGKTPREAWEGLLKVVRNGRFISLIFIVAGFWTIQGQLYATMPKYLTRLIGESASPEWLANINPLVVVICVVPITHLIRHFKPANAISIGLLIIPLSALSISLSPALEAVTGDSVSIVGRVALHPITVVVVIGIALQGLAECFLSPKFLEYASRQAPKGEEGLYLGYQHLTTFFAWALGFGISGHLLQRYCPDPGTMSPEWRQRWERGTDTGYRFELDPVLDADFKDGVPASSAVQEAFKEKGIALPGTARIERSDLDGGNAEGLVAIGRAHSPGFALDLVNGKVYWTDYEADKIQRANLDGSAVEDLVTVGLGCPKGIALDVAGGKMYWTDADTAKVQRADLDGSEVEDLVTTGLASPTEIALDLVGGKMYWADRGKKKIRRANLDGSEVEDVITTGLILPTGIALDASGGKIYWTDSGAEKIQRANLDGSRMERLVSVESGSLDGIALDVTRGKMYWTDAERAKVQRADLDGSNVEELATVGLISPTQIALDAEGGKMYRTAFSVATVQAGEDAGVWKIGTATGDYTVQRVEGRLLVYKDRRPLPAEYAQAHRIWYVFSAIGVTAFLAMLIFKWVTGVLDRRLAAKPS